MDENYVNPLARYMSENNLTVPEMKKRMLAAAKADRWARDVQARSYRIAEWASGRVKPSRTNARLIDAATDHKVPPETWGHTG